MFSLYISMSDSCCREEETLSLSPVCIFVLAGRFSSHTLPLRRDTPSVGHMEPSSKAKLKQTTRESWPNTVPNDLTFTTPLLFSPLFSLLCSLIYAQSVRTQLTRGRSTLALIFTKSYTIHYTNRNLTHSKWCHLLHQWQRFVAFFFTWQ